MPSVKISEELVEKAKIAGAALHRSIPKQIEYWAMLGKAAEDNPELTVEFIKGILIAHEEMKAGIFGEYQLRPRREKVDA
jgi:hypothetical protein